MPRARTSGLPAEAPRLHAKALTGSGVGRPSEAARSTGGCVKSLQRIGRYLLSALILLLWRKSASPPPRVETGALRKVLLVRIDTRVGNVLLTTPLLRALRKGLSGARVDCLVAAGKERRIDGLADRVLVFRNKDFFRAPLRFWKALLVLRRERYDVVVEAGHWHAFSFTSLWIAWFVGAPVRIGHARGEAERFLSHPVQKDPAIEREVPSKLELLRPLGLSAAGEHLETTVDSAAAVKAAASAIVVLGGGRPVAALNPGARKADHRWPAVQYGRLARKLSEKLGVAPLVLWGPGEESIAREVVEASGGTAVLAPPTDLASLAGVFRRSALVVTNDTGPMHLAVATGAPVVAVLLAEDGSRWSHSGLFTGVAVRTAGLEEVDQVFAAAEDLLKRAADHHAPRAQGVAS